MNSVQELELVLYDHEKKIFSLDEGIRSDPFNLCLSCKELDFFSLPWLTLRTVVKKDKENFSLHLNARYILHFFTTVVSEDGDLPTSVLREVIYSFGPRKFLKLL